MKECIHTKYIRNNEVIDTENFDKTILLNGISIYDVFRTFKGKGLFIEKHLERLRTSAKVVNLELWKSDEEIIEQIKKLIKANKIYDGNIKIIFNYPGRNELNGRNFIAYFISHRYPTEKQYKNGVETFFFNAERYNPNAKIINRLLKDETERTIQENNIYDVILVDRNGYITEGSRTNVFLIKGNDIYTSPVSNVLPGITRGFVIDICKKQGVNIIEEQLPYKCLKTIDAAFLSGTSPKVLPLSRIEGYHFDTKNEILRMIMNEYNTLIKEYLKNTKSLSE